MNRELGRLWFHYGSKLRSKRSFHSSGGVFFKGVCVPTYRAWGAADAMGRVRIRLKSVPPKTFNGFWRSLNGSKVECREIKVGTFGQSLSSVSQLGTQRKDKNRAEPDLSHKSRLHGWETGLWLFSGSDARERRPGSTFGHKELSKSRCRTFVTPGQVQHCLRGDHTKFGVILGKLPANDNSDFLNEKIKSSLRKWNHGRHALRRVSARMINIDPWEFWLYPKCGYFK